MLSHIFVLCLIAVTHIAADSAPSPVSPNITGGVATKEIKGVIQTDSVNNITSNLNITKLLSNKEPPPHLGISKTANQTNYISTSATKPLEASESLTKLIASGNKTSEKPKQYRIETSHISASTTAPTNYEKRNGTVENEQEVDTQTHKYHKVQRSDNFITGTTSHETVTDLKLNETTDSAVDEAMSIDNHSISDHQHFITKIINSTNQKMNPKIDKTLRSFKNLTRATLAEHRRNLGVTCYCNLASCVAKGYLCRSKARLCYTKQYYGPDPSARGYKLIHVYGCVEQLPSSLASKCSSQFTTLITPSNIATTTTPASTPQQMAKENSSSSSVRAAVILGLSRPSGPPSDAVQLSCCSHDVCNHERRPAFSAAPSSTNEQQHHKGIKGALHSNGRPSSDHHSLHQQLSSMLTVAAILVPTVGAILLITILFLTVRLIIVERNKSNNESRCQYHKALADDDQPPQVPRCFKVQIQDHSTSQDIPRSFRYHKVPTQDDRSVEDATPPPYTIHPSYSTKASQTTPTLEERYHQTKTSESAAATSFQQYLKALDQHHRLLHHHIHHNIDRDGNVKQTPINTFGSHKKSPKHLSSFRSKKPLPCIKPRSSYPKDSLAGYLMPIFPKQQCMPKSPLQTHFTLPRSFLSPSSFDSPPNISAPSTPDHSAEPRECSPFLKHSNPTKTQYLFPPPLYSPSYCSSQSSFSPTKSVSSPGVLGEDDEDRGQSFVEELLSLAQKNQERYNHPSDYVYQS